MTQNTARAELGLGDNVFEHFGQGETSAYLGNDQVEVGRPVNPTEMRPPAGGAESVRPMYPKGSTSYSVQGVNDPQMGIPPPHTFNRPWVGPHNLHYRGMVNLPSPSSRFDLPLGNPPSKLERPGVTPNVFNPVMVVPPHPDFEGPRATPNIVNPVRVIPPPMGYKGPRATRD